MIDRNTALTLLAAQNPEPGLLAHSLQTEAVMAALATHLGQDVALWSLTGLLHDLDYPRTKEAPACHGLLPGNFLSFGAPARRGPAPASPGPTTAIAPLGRRLRRPLFELPLRARRVRHPGIYRVANALVGWSGPRACPAMSPSQKGEKER